MPKTVPLNSQRYSFLLGFFFGTDMFTDCTKTDLVSLHNFPLKKLKSVWWVKWLEAAVAK